MKNRTRENCTSGSVRDEAGQPPHLLGRRQFLHLAAGAAALPAVSRIARAQAYPSRPVRWIVGFAPGGGNDIVARLMGQWLSERLGQPFVIENRPGAGTNIATEVVVNAPPDGYTLLLAGIPNAFNASLFGKLNFNFIRDIAPVAGIIRMPLVMVVNPSVPANTVPEFIAYAKANPGKVNMASAGTGGGTHLAGELFKAMAGVNLVHVPRWASGGPVSLSFFVDRVHQNRQAARTCDDQRDALGGSAGASDRRRVCPRLRDQCVVRGGRAKGHAHRGHRQAQPEDQ
jgi:tripartite-type tricarboxylate transporter receptor subunit TctC